MPYKKKFSYTDELSHDILKIDNLTLKYNNKKVLDTINISVKRNYITTILGPNGGGKTSLIKAIVGINKNYSGRITFAKDIRVSYMPQNFTINSLMPITVEYFLLNSSLGKEKNNDMTQAIELVGIDNILKHQVSEISAGQTQLLLLARCLITQPDLTVLDEPVSAMDIDSRTKFYNIIKTIAQTKLTSVLMTSHDLNSVVSLSDYIICIDNSIHCQGRSEKVIKNKTLDKIFNTYVTK